MATLVRASSRVYTVLGNNRQVFRPLARSLSQYPSDRKYRSSHEWAKVDGDIATVGITDHAQAALGDIVFAELPEIGTEATAGEKAATVESVKAAADIYAPITGEIVGINENLESQPDLINQGPHEDGWMFQVKVTDPAQFDELMDSSSYESSLKKDN